MDFGRRVLLGAFALTFGASGSSQASPVSFHVKANITTAYDYIRSQYVPISPLTGTFDFTFDDAGITRDCSPSSCPNQTIFPSGISSISTLSPLIPSYFGSGTGAPDVYYAPEFSTSQYSGVFDWANGGTTYFNAGSGEYLTHVIYVSVLKLASDTTTYESATSFLLGTLSNPDAFRVAAGEAWYASQSANPTLGDFTQGFDWRDNAAVIAGVNGQVGGNPPFNVSEPSSSLIGGLGFVALIASRFRRRSAVFRPLTTEMGDQEQRARVSTKASR